jgi:hypothetical protein
LSSVSASQDGHGALGTVLVDDQLKQRRGIDVGDHPDRPDRQRRCSSDEVAHGALRLDPHSSAGSWVDTRVLLYVITEL